MDYQHIAADEIHSLGERGPSDDGPLPTGGETPSPENNTSADPTTSKGFMRKIRSFALRASLVTSAVSFSLGLRQNNPEHDYSTPQGIVEAGREYLDEATIELTGEYIAQGAGELYQRGQDQYQALKEDYPVVEDIEQGVATTAAVISENVKNLAREAANGLEADYHRLDEEYAIGEQIRDDIETTREAHPKTSQFIDETSQDIKEFAHMAGEELARVGVAAQCEFQEGRDYVGAETTGISQPTTQQQTMRQ